MAALQLTRMAGITTAPCAARRTSFVPCAPRMSLSSGMARVSTPLPAAKRPVMSRPSRGSAVTVRASDVTYEVAPEGHLDYAPLLAILGLVAYINNRIALTAPQLLKTVAWYQIFVAGVALLFRRAQLDNLASVVAPTILAVYTLGLSQISYIDAAVALFGYYLSERLEGPFWGWVATLAGAIYAGYAPQWYVAAFALLSGTRLVRGGQNNKVPLAPIPVLAAAGYAFWKDLTPQFTIALLIGQIVASALKYAESVSDSS